MTTLVVFLSCQLFHKEILRESLIHKYLMHGRWYVVFWAGLDQIAQKKKLLMACLDCLHLKTKASGMYFGSNLFPSEKDGTQKHL